MGDNSNRDVKEEVRLRSDIVETIGRYVPLKKAGARYKALCPFHKEKTPSFVVDPNKQAYHCFGCDAGGDVFDFVMQQENVSFPEALRILADRAGVPYEPGKSGVSQEYSQKSSLYKLHEALAHYYNETLRKDPAAKIARDYLTERDLEAAIDLFQIGFAPPQPHAVTQWAEQASYPMALLEKAGVLLPSDRGGAPYDRFKGRLMFPIRDEQGRVVGFSGRILDQSSPAKYVNSPETPLFKKSRVLYGLDRARQKMTDARQALVCEGQIDVIRCHLAGFTTAVAPQGTALTEGHARLLKRYADEIVMVFDADTAGQNAVLRCAEPLLREGLTMRVVMMPAGEDPDTLIRARGIEALGERIEGALSLVAFHVQLLEARGELASQAGRLRATRAVLETIQHAPSAVQREQHVREASQRLDISEEALRQDMMRMIRPARPARDSDAQEKPSASALKSYPPNETALIELMMAHPEVLDLVSQYLSPEAITHATCRTLIQAILTLPEVDEQQLTRTLSEQDEECRRLASRIRMSTFRRVDGEEVSCIHAAQDMILKLRIQQLERELQSCLARMKSAAPEERRHLHNESAQLMVLKKRLQEGWKTAQPILDLDE